MKKIALAIIAAAGMALSAPASALLINTAIGADETEAATTLTDALLAPGGGINVLSSTFVGNLSTPQSGTYSDLNLVSSAGGPSIALDDGIFLTSGSAEIPATNTDSAFTGVPATGGDAEVTAILDAAAAPSSVVNDVNSLFIEFTVDPGVNSVNAQFVFGSDEFPDQDVTDFFLFIVDGVNYAFFPDNSLVSFVVGVNAANFVDNSNPGQYDIEYDGLSIALGVSGLLDTNLASHTLKVVIGDTADSAFDSGVFIAGLTASESTSGGICGGVDQPPCPDDDPNNEVPEPTSLALLAAGAAGMGAIRRRRRTTR